MGMQRLAGRNKNAPHPFRYEAPASIHPIHFLASNQASARARAFSRIFRKKNE